MERVLLFSWLLCCWNTRIYYCCYCCVARFSEATNQTQNHSFPSCSSNTRDCLTLPTFQGFSEFPLPLPFQVHGQCRFRSVGSCTAALSRGSGCALLARVRWELTGVPLTSFFLLKLEGQTGALRKLVLLEGFQQVPVLVLKSCKKLCVFVSAWWMITWKELRSSGGR